MAELDEDLTPAEPEAPAETSLSATGRVILGMIALGKRTGYEIKQLVDRSTRHFWAASYGQIYPELRRLEEQGLITGRAEPSGGRARTVYELTDAGDRALQEWLAGELTVNWELRDEGMLKLFFSDFTDPEHRLSNLRAMREWHERKRDALREVRAHAMDAGQGPAMTVELGLGMTEWLIEWCRAAEQRLGAENLEG
jgi:DNA-binding PadR family transcriptional regulator